jgi:hypothetical protein
MNISTKIMGGGYLHGKIKVERKKEVHTKYQQAKIISFNILLP